MPARSAAPRALPTAVAASLIMLTWAVGPTPATRNQPPSDARLSLQPLIGLGGGITVREITRRTPFSMVALTGGDLTGTSARVRAKHADGSWGPWYKAETLAAGRDGATRVPRGTDPVFVGTTTTVQIAVSRPRGAPVTQPAVQEPVQEPLPQAVADSGLGYRPATAEEPLAQNISAVLISPPLAPVDTQWTPPTAVMAPGQPPTVISRAQWGADESIRCANPQYGNRIRAAVVHHTAGGNDYSPQESAAIVQAIYAYHTKTLGWCDIAYNALVDKYGQVFEGRAGGITKAVEGSHTGGFNRDTWGVAMIGDFDEAAPTPIQLRTVGRLLGWRLGIDGVDPRGSVTLSSAGGSFTKVPAGATTTLPAVFSHRDVGNTDCPGNAAYALMDEIRDTAAHFNYPLGAEELAAALRGGAIYQRWQEMGGPNGVLGSPTSPESVAAGSARYVTFDRGAMYWSPETGAQPVTGAIYDAWASLGYERGALGLPTSGEIQEPQWVKQNFQHGTLNFSRLDGTVTRVMDGVALELPPPPPSGPPVQLERFSPPIG
ncbi:LGFP repeat-containing protein [Mycobacterium sp. SM1]|uniref:N-acetylmuramoyl-L-alanine amidase n=1 Tax=Mycobacterium sp. SM1 TaxID=2816243 RepID=UPI001BCA8DFB|nr:N-acetylmuramoyl-L-alanine amidase [Mycobacterium sp. SM1]MBS4728000.1 LGFP repeat-containing protein [Mycobacterium sp. SM1]